MGGTEYKRTNIINHLIGIYNYKSYLEIGVYKGDNFGKINIKHKDGVDVHPRCVCKYEMTSDEFFNAIPSTQMYDIVLVDGLHTAEQANRDITNSLRHLNSNGTIIAHDCNPPSIKSADIKVSGNVWESILDIRLNRDDLSVMVVNTDHGCGIIRRGTQEKFVIPPGYSPTDYKLLNDHRKKLLNLISIEEFLQLHGK